MTKRNMKDKLTFACGGCTSIAVKVDEDGLCVYCGQSTILVDATGRVWWLNKSHMPKKKRGDKP